MNFYHFRKQFNNERLNVELSTWLEKLEKKLTKVIDFIQMVFLRDYFRLIGSFHGKCQKHTYGIERLDE